MNTIEAVNDALDNLEARGIALDIAQQRALLYKYRDLIKRKDELQADLAAAREDVARMDKALRRIATMECHSEGGIPVTPSELREIARAAIDSARAGGGK